MTVKIHPEIAAMTEEIVAIRRDFHMHPELGFQETRTAGVIEAKLREWGVEDITTGVGGTGIVAVIPGNRPGREAVGLRADFDALPMDDLSGLPWASRTPGKAHTCGHDGHAAGLLAAARYLNSTRNFPGRVICVFQPAEETEGLSGAKAMIDDGLFERWPMREIIMLHDFPDLPVDEIGFGRPGPYHAASDSFLLTVRGKGGHGGNPQAAIDPVAASQQLFSALQTIVSRNVPPDQAAVLTVGALVAGDLRAGNIVPETVSMRGTIRTFSKDVRALMERRLREVCRGIGIAFRVAVDVDFQHGVPSTSNDAAICETAKAVGAEIFGPERVHSDLPMISSSEDFSFFEEIVPGIVLRAGTGDETHVYPLHNPKFEFNDKALPGAAMLLARMAEARLEALNGGCAP